MSTSDDSATATQTARAIRAWAEDRKVWVELEDGRIVGFPADKYHRLKHADDKQLAEVSIELRGRALRWEQLDEDLTVAGILAGRWLP